MVYITAELPSLAWLLSKRLGPLAVLPSRKQPMEKELAEAGRAWCFPHTVILYLSVLPRVFGTKETRRRSHCPRGLQSKQMLALRLLEIFQMNYSSVENSFLTK